jgi:orotate phosphoribosyltransferase
VSSTSSSKHDRLVALLRDRSVRHGEFTLASGQKSDLYVDVRQTSLHPEGAWLIGRLILEQLHDDVIAIGGMSLGADPPVCAAVTASFETQRPLPGFLIRKEPKGHGVERHVVGRSSLPSGAKVIIIEDTTTTGGSLLKAVTHARESGLEVIQCLTVVDRQEGAERRLAEQGLTLEALVTRAQLVE